MAEKLKLVIVKPTAEGVATLLRKLTGKEPDLAKIREGLKPIADTERPA